MYTYPCFLSIAVLRLQCKSSSADRYLSSGLGYDTQGPGLCVGTLTTPVRAWVPRGTAQFPLVTMKLAMGTDSGVTAETNLQSATDITTLTRAVASADGLMMYWKKEDLSSFPEEYAISVAKDMGVSFTPGSASRAGHLSTGAKIGIGVGVSVGVLLALFFVVYVVLWRRKRSTHDQNSPLHVQQTNTAKMEDQDASRATRKWYLGGRWRSEAEVKNEPGELDSRGVRIVEGPPAELDGSNLHSER